MRSWFIFRTAIERAAADVEPESVFNEPRCDQASVSPLASWADHFVLPKAGRLAWPRAVPPIGLLSLALWVLIVATLLLFTG